MQKSIRLGGPALLLVGLAGVAHADVTGREVWESWQAAAEEMGQTFAPGAVLQDGDRLTVRDLAITMEMPEVDLDAMVGEIVFTDRADGTVEITMSPSYEMALDVDAETGEQAELTLVVSQPGLTIVASGDPDDVAYDFVAPEIGVALDGVIVDGEQQPVAANVRLEGSTGRYRVTQGEPAMLTSRVNSDLMTIAVDAENPDNPDETLSLAMEFADLAGSSEGAMGMLGDPEALADMVADGMATAGSISHGASSISVAVEGPDAFTFDSTSEAGSYDVALGPEGLINAFGNDMFEMRVTGAEIPFPEVTAALEEIGFGFAIPVLESETPQEFAVNLTLADLTVSDMIWSMFDPAGQLPRDPATLIVDVTGMANWFQNILDPEAQEEMGGGIPGELHELTLEELVLAVAGAELTGAGAFTFDNSDLETFDGLPAPDGTVNLRLVGANQLIDTLVAMGVVPEDQAMGARMMLGLFARPGDGEDTLVSQIEVNADGSIFANGQRLQ